MILEQNNFTPSNINTSEHLQIPNEMKTDDDVDGVSTQEYKISIKFKNRKRNRSQMFKYRTANRSEDQEQSGSLSKKMEFAADEG